MPRAPQRQNREHEQRIAYGVLVEDGDERVGDKADGERAGAKADKVDDEEQKRRRRRAHAHADQVLHEREGGRQIKPADEDRHRHQPENRRAIVRQVHADAERQRQGDRRSHDPRAPTQIAARQNIGEITAHERADRRDDTGLQREIVCDLRQRHGVRELQELRGERQAAVAHRRDQRCADDRMDKRLLRQHEARYLAKARRRASDIGAVDVAARGLFEGEREIEREQQARDAQDVERGAPTPFAADLSADKIAERGAERHAQRIDRERGAALGYGKQIGDHRMRGRTAARLADAHADAEGGELPEPLGEAAQRRHHRPHGHRGDQDPFAADAVGEHRDRDAERRIKQREAQAREKAERGVADLQILHDLNLQDVQDLAVGVV